MLRPIRRKVRLEPGSFCARHRFMIAYCAICFGMQVPLEASGVVPGGQRVPQDETLLGSQQAPFCVMPSAGFEHGVTHWPPRLIWPVGHGIPVSGGGQATPSGLVTDLTPTVCAGRCVLSQRQATPTADEPTGSRR